MVSDIFVDFSEKDAWLLMEKKKKKSGVFRWPVSMSKDRLDRYPVTG